MSIADIVGVLNQIPTDIMFCKADTDLNANSVDDYIKGVMSRYVFTSQGNYKMNELMDKFRDSNVEVKLVYYPYSDIINEECFGTNSNELSVRSPYDFTPLFCRYGWAFMPFVIEQLNLSLTCS